MSISILFKYLFQCGGDYGRVSVYAAFSAPVTLGLNVYLTDSDGTNVAIDYDYSNVTRQEFNNLLLWQQKTN